MNSEEAFLDYLKTPHYRLALQHAEHGRYCLAVQSAFDDGYRACRKASQKEETEKECWFLNILTSGGGSVIQLGPFSTKEQAAAEAFSQGVVMRCRGQLYLPEGVTITHHQPMPKGFANQAEKE